MKINRTENAIRNVFWGVVEKIVLLILPFAVRTVFIHTLGVQYLGLSSLFTSILSVLSIANLGFDSAIVFSMYKPIANNDDETVCALLNIYKKIYHVVGSIILVLGLCIMPFLPNFIEGGYPDDINIYVLYLIYLFDAVIGYLMFGYKTSLFRAYQRNDVTSKRSIVLNLISNLLQIILLILFCNYYAYIMVAPLICITTNLINAYLAKKMFPNIEARGTISVEQKKDIAKRVGGLVSYKIYSVIFNSVDSIVISSFLGLSLLAIYNNYFYIQTTVNSLLNTFTISITAGIGHKMATNSVEDNYADFKGLTFINAWVSGWCAVCFISLYQHFMVWWVGDNMLLSMDTVIWMVLLFVLPRISVMTGTYREAAGLWWEDRYRQLIATVVNLSTNIFLVKRIGINGVIISTLICTVFINIPFGGRIIFKNYFKRSILPYFGKLIFYLTVITSVAAVTYFVCGLLPSTGFISMILKGVICLIVPNILFLLVYSKLPEFKFFKDLVIRLIGNRLKRKGA